MELNFDNPDLYTGVRCPQKVVEIGHFGCNYLSMQRVCKTKSIESSYTKISERKDHV